MNYALFFYSPFFSDAEFDGMITGTSEPHATTHANIKADQKWLHTKKIPHVIMMICVLFQLHNLVTT